MSDLTREGILRALGHGVYYSARALRVLHGMDAAQLLAKGWLERHPTDPAWFRYSENVVEPA